jgi:hypothetical protein
MGMGKTLFLLTLSDRMPMNLAHVNAKSLVLWTHGILKKGGRLICDYRG